MAPPAEPRPWLPAMLFDLAEAHGLATALRLAELFGGQPKVIKGRVPGAVTRKVEQAIERCSSTNGTRFDVSKQDGRGSGGKVRIITISHQDSEGGVGRCA